MAIISKSEAAKRAGITWAGIQHHFKQGTSDFFVGKKVNSTHPDFIALCKKRGFRANPTEGSGRPDEQKSEGMVATKTRRLEAQTKKAELDLAIAKKELVELDLVKVMVFDYLHALNKRMLSLGSNTVDRVLQLAASGDEDARQKIIDLVSSEASREIKQTKAKINKNLQKIKNA